MYCTQCGSANADEARFCSTCGCRLEEQAPPEELYRQPQEEQNEPQRHGFSDNWRKFMRSPLMLVAIAVYVIAAFWGLRYFNNFVYLLRNFGDIFRYGIFYALDMLPSLGIFPPLIVSSGLILLLLEAFKKDGSAVRAEGALLVLGGVALSFLLTSVNAVTTIIELIRYGLFNLTSYNIGVVVGIVINLTHGAFLLLVANNSRQALANGRANTQSLKSAAVWKIVVVAVFLISVLLRRTALTFNAILTYLSYALFAVAMLRYEKNINN